MSGPFWLIWSIASTVLMGVFITVVLLIPELQRSLFIWVPIAVALGLVGAFPLSYVANKAAMK